MKKAFFVIGMLAVALSLTNCTKEIDSTIDNVQPSVKEGIPFELFANPADTKTTISGMVTSWKADDGVNVFHAVSGGSTYISDGQFTIASEDIASGRFTGTISSENPPVSGDTYDWYLIYPYNSHTDSPVNSEGQGRYYFGKRSDQSQVQTGNSSTSHLSGTNFPLYGKATGVAYDAVPSITMNHVASFIEVKVTNKNDAPLTVSSVSFTAPTGTTIVGQYVINFSSMTYADYNSYTSETANLTVNEGTALNKNETASFYIGIKPFTVVATSENQKTLKVSVNGYEKNITLSSNVSFTAGKMKKINFAYDKADEVYELVESDGAFEDGGKYIFAIKGGQSTDNTYYFINNAGSSSNLTESALTISGGKITNPSVDYVFEAETNGTGFSLKNSKGNYINGSAAQINTNGAERCYVPSFLSASNCYKLTDKDASRSIRYYTGPSIRGYADGSAQSFVDQIATAAALTSQRSGAWYVFKLGGTTTTSEPTISNTTVSDASARGGAGLTKDIVLSNFASAPVLTATPDGTYVTAASVGSITTSSATVTYTLAPNYSGAAVDGSITISDGDGHSGTITVSQVADVFTVSRTSVELNANSGATTTITVTSDFDWTIDDSSLNGFTVSPNSFTYSDNQKQTVTITATGNNATASPVVLDIFCVTRTADSKDSDDITVSQKSAKLATPVINLEGNSSTKKVTVSWAKNNDATKYQFYVLDEDSNIIVDEEETTDNNTTSFEFSIEFGVEYFVFVRSIGDNNPWITSEYGDDSITVSSGSKSVTFDFSSFTETVTGGWNGAHTENPITITATSANTNKSGQVRFQNGGTVTFTGATITRIEIINSGNYPGNFSADVGSYSVSGNNGIWTGSATTVVLTNNGNGTRTISIVVTYTE